MEEYFSVVGYCHPVLLPYWISKAAKEKLGTASWIYLISPSPTDESG